MNYMVIEKFRPGKVKEMYQRFAEKGRMMPEGVNYVNSWIDEQLTTCYQVMEADDKKNIDEWISHWDDLVDFEVVAVISSGEAKERVMGGE